MVASIHDVAEQQLVSLLREVMPCRLCFQDLGVRSARVDLPQPRLVGDSYWTAQPRILIVMLNPGGGESYSERTARHLVGLLQRFSTGADSVDAVFAQQREDMPNWGRGGRFLHFYLNGFGLQLNKIAFANIAWCATKGDKYPRSMLDRCFDRYTRRLFELLDPNVVLLSGSATHRYAALIARSLPSARIVLTLHYAHRGGLSAETAEFQRVRALLASASG